MGDPAVDGLAGSAPGVRYGFAPGACEGAHAFMSDGWLTLRLDDTETLLAASELPLLGQHNRINALTAALTARLAGAAASGITEGLRTARPLPHRMEPVAEGGGIVWVNDSKATNLAATRSALESLTDPVVLLLGGKDKGEDFGDLRPVLGDRVRSVVAFGAAGGRIVEELEGAARMELVQGDLAEVVAAAARHARPGDIVLLSPACSSFDMFEDYEDRGHRFSALARGMV